MILLKELLNVSTTSIGVTNDTELARCLNMFWGVVNEEGSAGQGVKRGECRLKDISTRFGCADNRRINNRIEFVR